MRIGENSNRFCQHFKKGWGSIMDQGKLTRILKSMEEHEVPQMIVSDPVSDRQVDFSGRKTSGIVSECERKS